MSSKKNRTESDVFSLKKKAFIEAYASCFGNVTKSCKIADTARSTYYEWIATDESFAKTISGIEPKAMLVDLAEDFLVKNIKAGSTPEILFLLKTLGKDRGYVEKIQTEDTTKKDIEITVEIVLPTKPETDEDSGN